MQASRLCLTSCLPHFSMIPAHAWLGSRQHADESCHVMQLTVGVLGVLWLDQS